MLALYLGGCSSPLSQPIALSVFMGSRPSQTKHCNLRGPSPVGGNAKMRWAPHLGQVSRSACPMALSVAPDRPAVHSKAISTQRIAFPRLTGICRVAGVGRLMRRPGSNMTAREPNAQQQLSQVRRKMSCARLSGAAPLLCGFCRFDYGSPLGTCKGLLQGLEFAGQGGDFFSQSSDFSLIG